MGLRTGRLDVPLIGYARVSTVDQDLALQRDALHQVGCTRIFEDFGVSGAKTERPALTAALVYIREGDVLVVWKLDRLGRSLAHLIDTVSDLEKRGIGLRSLTEVIDTTTSGGRLILHVFCALGQFERDLIRERTQAGLTAAAARGRKGGPQTGGHRRQAEASAHADDPGLQRSRGGDAPEGWENRALRGACDGRGQNADDGWTMSFEELATRCRSTAQ